MFDSIPIAVVIHLCRPIFICCGASSASTSVFSSSSISFFQMEKSFLCKTLQKCGTNNVEDRERERVKTAAITSSGKIMHTHTHKTNQQENNNNQYHSRASYLLADTCWPTFSMAITTRNSLTIAPLWGNGCVCVCVYVSMQYGNAVLASYYSHSCHLAPNWAICVKLKT